MRRIKYSVICLAVWMIFLIQTGIVMAAEGTVTYGSSSYSPTEGQEFQVGVYVNGSEAIGAYEFYLDYNADMMEYVSGADSGGGGRLKFTGYGNASSYNYMLTFRAKKAGSSNISISNVYLGPLNPSSGDSMTITAAASAPVSIQGPSTASGECRLAELTVSPTGLWGFSPDKTEYDITVDNDISKLAITAKAESDKASVVISDTNLAEGVNTIHIKVTAENGTVKDYSIIVRRKSAPTQTQPPTTISDPGIENLKVSFLVNGRDMYVTENVDNISAPDGFQKTKVSYQGQEIPAFTSLTQNITLFYLRDGLGENGDFYAYNGERDTVYPYIRLTNPTGSYMIVSPEADVRAPEGFVETTLSLSSGGDESVATAIQAWLQGNDPEFFLIYALNDKGECAFYQYDTKEKTLQRYHGTGTVQTTAPEEATSSTEPEDTGKIAELENTIITNKLNYQIEAKNRLLIIIALAVLCVVLLIAVIGLIFKLKGQADGADPDMEDMDEDIDEMESIEAEPNFVETSSANADKDFDLDNDPDLDMEESQIPKKRVSKRARKKARKREQELLKEAALTKEELTEEALTEEIQAEEIPKAEVPTKKVSTKKGSTKKAPAEKNSTEKAPKKNPPTEEPAKKKEVKRPVSRTEKPKKKIEPEEDDFLMDLDDDDFTFFDYDDEK